MIASDTTDLIVAQTTHAGETGKNNEDRSVVGAFRESPAAKEIVNLAMVADGIGGHAAGEIASDLAVRAVYDHLVRGSADDPIGTLQLALLAANQAIYERSRSEPQLQGMGSTAVVALVLGRRLYVAHVGDSRMYLIRDGAIQQLTVDHTWVQEAISTGLLTREEARKHPNRHVIRRYLGHNLETNPVDLTVQYAPGETLEQMERNQGLPLLGSDMLLLCSDGLTDLVEDEEILSFVTQHGPQAATEQLVLLARQRGGFDNITVILLKAPELPPPSRPMAPVAAAPAAVAAVAARTQLAAPARRAPGRRSVVALGALGLAGVTGLLAVSAVAVLYFLNQTAPTASAPASPSAAAPTPLPAATTGVSLPPPEATSTSTAAPGPTAAPLTVTMAPTEAPSLAPTAQAYVVVTTDASIRFLPDPDAEEIGVLLANATAKVFGRDPDGLWWYVEFPQGTASRGWVFRTVTNLTGDVSTIPIVNEAGTPLAPVGGAEGSASNTGQPPSETPQG